MKDTSFFAKVIADLKSDRETRVQRNQDIIEISYPAISREDFKKNRFLIPMVLVFCIFLIFGAVATMIGFASSIAEMPPDTPVDEKYIFFVPILLQVIFAVGIPAFLYRKAIRVLFITEKLTLHPSYFVYSNGIWGKFREVLRVNKENLDRFGIGGNPSPVLRFLSKGQEGANHLYVNYNKRKKVEIMGGRPDSEYMKMIDILEPYRTSAGIYDMAVAVKEREKAKQPETQAPELKKKKGLIKAITALFGSEPLDEKDCLKTNGILGLMMLPGIIFFFFQDKTGFPFPADFLIVQIIAGTVLAGGWLLAVFRASMTKRILVVQGSVICVLVFVYTVFIWQVARLIASGEVKVRMGHAPGILAYGAAYGIKQVVDFSGLSAKSGVARRLPVIFFIIGGCCDLLVIYFMIKSFCTIGVGPH